MMMNKANVFFIIIIFIKFNIVLQKKNNKQMLVITVNNGPYNSKCWRRKRSFSSNTSAFIFN